MEGHIGGLVVIAIITVFNALIIAARNALENVNETNIQKWADTGNKKAKRVIRLLGEPERYIDFATVIPVMAGIIIGMIISTGYYGSIYELVSDMVNEQIMRYVPALMLLIEFIIIQFIAVIGVMLPKKLSIKYADSFSCALSGILEAALNVFRPVMFIVNRGTNLCLRFVGINPSELVDNVTEEEIISIVNEGQEQGVLEEEEAEMISNIIELDEKEARDIMTHRKKIIAIDTGYSVEEALMFMLEERYSRYPLYSENIDNIIGILHIKDVMKFYMKPELRKKAVANVARKAYFIPDTQSVNTVFHDMQVKKAHMAVVIDEYGQTAGIVAMEDILEEIVGDIQDEYDEEEEMIIVTDEKKGVYEVSGETKLEELKDELEADFTEDDIENFDTLSGLLVSKLEHIPSSDTLESVEYCGYIFNITEVKDNMISKVRIIRTVIEDEEALEEAVSTVAD